MFSKSAFYVETVITVKASKKFAFCFVYYHAQISIYNKLTVIAKETKIAALPDVGGKTVLQTQNLFVPLRRPPMIMMLRHASGGHHKEVNLDKVA